MEKQLDRDYFREFSAKTEAELQDYTQPSNARELKNVAERELYKADPESLIDSVALNPFDAPYRPGKRDNCQSGCTSNYKPIRPCTRPKTTP